MTCGTFPYWLLQHSANSVLDYWYSWSSWCKGSFFCLDMSECTCGVAIDATFPEMALDTSEDEGHSSHATPGSTVDTCSASVPVLLDVSHVFKVVVYSDPEVDSCPALQRHGKVCTVDASVACPRCLHVEIWTLRPRALRILQSLFAARALPEKGYRAWVTLAMRAGSGCAVARESDSGA